VPVGNAASSARGGIVRSAALLSPAHRIRVLMETQLFDTGGAIDDCRKRHHGQRTAHAQGKVVAFAPLRRDPWPPRSQVVKSACPIDDVELFWAPTSEIHSASAC